MYPSVDFDTQLHSIIQQALAEDIGSGDITSASLIPEGAALALQIVAREQLVLCGADVPVLVYHALSQAMKKSKPHYTRRLADGAQAQAGEVIASLQGNAALLLAGERVMLNLMQRMSGVATLTHRYVQAITGTKAKILDTRKTMPAMRHIDKYAVRMGGGVNHRMGLYDAVIIKDNHIATSMGAVSLAERVHQVRTRLMMSDPPRAHVPIIVECDRLEQLREVLPAKPDCILLDNMSLADLQKAVEWVAGAVPLEASGGVTLETVAGIARTGVDYISVGALTHSAPAVDIGLDALHG